MSQRLIPSLTLVLALAAPALAAVHVEPVDDGRFEVTFRHQPVIAAQSVHVAGSFNGWSPTATPMTDPDGDGIFTATLELPRGRHHYKFVLNGGTWQHDGDNPATDPDGHSGLNSVLDLTNPEAAGTGERGDGRIDVAQVVHEPGDLAYAAAVDGRRTLVLRVHVLADDVEGVRVEARPGPRGGDVRARRLATIDGRDVYEARLAYSRAPSRVRYAFVLEDGDAEATVPAGRERFTLSTKQAGRFETPEWVRDAVFYQIFPDRFRDGDATNQPELPRRPEGRSWHIDDRYLEEWGAEPAHFNFMGGDLAGITEKADYLEDLGVTAIYLNPIFAAESNHRYDAADYERIDPALGDGDDFDDLTDALEDRDIRLLLDCVFNHTGDEHYAFQDVEEKGRESRYWDWYFVEGWPISKNPPNYKCWWDFGDLPQLDTSNDEVVRHLMKVGKDWLDEGAHGWRLDVPNEVDAVNPGFWPEFRRQIKQQDPDAYIVGEIWTDARSWLQGDKFDAVMNYPVRSAALEFIVKDGQLDARGFHESLGRQLATYPEPALQVQFNLLGSHDTPRVRTLAGGDARRVRLAMTFLFAWPGAPVIYYGDEVGLEGGKDPQCRRCYPWDEPEAQDRTTLEHVRRLGSLRSDERALRRGYVEFLHAEGDVAAFARVAEAGDAGRPVVCILNASHARSGRVEVPLGALAADRAKTLLGPEATVEGDRLVVELGPWEGALVALD